MSAQVAAAKTWEEIQENRIPLFERSTANKCILEDLQACDYRVALSWVYNNVGMKADMAANCETFIFAGFGWVMQGDAELATQDFDHALELYDELPDFDTAQPFPYPRQWLRMVHDLLDAKGNDGLDEAKAILRKDVTFISWDEPTVDSTTRDTKPALIIEPVPKPTVSSSRQVTPPPTAQSLAKEKKRKTKILGSVTKEVQSGGASKRMRTESNASTASTGATRPKRKL